VLLDPLGQTLTEIRDAKHPSLGSSVLLHKVQLTRLRRSGGAVFDLQQTGRTIP
jgi:hypothetical protein